MHDGVFGFTNVVEMANRALDCTGKTHSMDTMTRPSSWRSACRCLAQYQLRFVDFNLRFYNFVEVLIFVIAFMLAWGHPQGDLLILKWPRFNRNLGGGVILHYFIPFHAISLTLWNEIEIHEVVWNENSLSWNSMKWSYEMAMKWLANNAELNQSFQRWLICWNFELEVLD